DSFFSEHEAHGELWPGVRLGNSRQPARGRVVDDQSSGVRSFFSPSVAMHAGILQPKSQVHAVMARPSIRSRWLAKASRNPGGNGSEPFRAIERRRAVALGYKTLGG